VCFRTGFRQLWYDRVAGRSAGREEKKDKYEDLDPPHDMPLQRISLIESEGKKQHITKIKQDHTGLLYPVFVKGFLYLL
jgi:hypothetical protein